MISTSLSDYFRGQDIIVLDGGLATELENRGCNIDGPLWSARLLFDNPDAIQQLHYDYLKAGADIITTATYQASITRFKQLGKTDADIKYLFQLSVDLAKRARAIFWSEPKNRNSRVFPLIAASLGPYGAYLADGSEYHGKYQLDDQQLLHFHEERLDWVMASAPDLLAFETIPSANEALAIKQLLQKYPASQAWLSFSCKDDQHISDDTPIEKAVSLFEGMPNILAIGVNCTAPEYIQPLIKKIKVSVSLPVIVYPNSGEGWDAANKTWISHAQAHSLTDYLKDWISEGATIIGGCCRTTPAEISNIRSALL
jgi:homocysteine S-methyltransferase